MSKYYSIPFASSGDKTAIPDPAQGSGTVSYTEGWGPLYEEDQVTNPSALDVDRENENSFKFEITELLKEIQDTGILIYRSDANYVVNSHVTGSDGFIYQALVANGPVIANETDPVGDLTGVWVIKASSEPYKLSVVTATDPAFAIQAGTRRIRFTLIGAGGGGGSTSGSTAANVAVGAGGGAGGMAIVEDTAPTGTYNITVGAPGTGATAGNDDAADGGDTSVVGGAVASTANGGIAGVISPAATGNFTVVGAVGGAAGGNIGWIGGDASEGRVVNTEIVARSNGGLSPWTSPNGVVSDGDGGGAGTAAHLVAGGGGGGAATGLTPAVENAGGDGGDGLVLVEEFLV